MKRLSTLLFVMFCVVINFSIFPMGNHWDNSAGSASNSFLQIFSIAGPINLPNPESSQEQGADENDFFRTLIVGGEESPSNPESPQEGRSGGNELFSTFIMQGSDEEDESSGTYDSPNSPVRTRYNSSSPTRVQNDSPVVNSQFAFNGTIGFSDLLKRDVNFVGNYNGQNSPQGSLEKINYLKNLYIMSLEELNTLRSTNINNFNLYLQDVWSLYSLEVSADFESLSSLYDSRLRELNINNFPSFTKLSETLLLETKTEILNVFPQSAVNDLNSPIFRMRNALIHNSIGNYVDVDNLWIALGNIFSEVYGVGAENFTFNGGLMPLYTGTGLPEDIKDIYCNLCTKIKLEVESLIFIENDDVYYDHVSMSSHLLIENVTLDEGSVYENVLSSQERIKRLRAFLLNCLPDEIRKDLTLIRCLVLNNPKVLSVPLAISKTEILNVLPTTNSISRNLARKNQQKKDLLVAALYRYFLFYFRVNLPLSDVGFAPASIDFWLKLLSRAQPHYTSYNKPLFSFVTSSDPELYSLSVLDKTDREFTGLSESKLIERANFVFLRNLLLLTAKQNGKFEVIPNVTQDILRLSWETYNSSYRKEEIYQDLYNSLIDAFNNFLNDPVAAPGDNSSYHYDWFKTIMSGGWDYRQIENSPNKNVKKNFFKNRLNVIFSSPNSRVYSNIHDSITDHVGIYYSPSIFKYVLLAVERTGDWYSRIMLQNQGHPVAFSPPNDQRINDWVTCMGDMFQSFAHCINGRIEGITNMFLRLLNANEQIFEDLAFDELAKNLSHIVALDRLNLFQFAASNDDTLISDENATYRGYLFELLSRRDSRTGEILKHRLSDGNMSDIRDDEAGSYGLPNFDRIYEWFNADGLLRYLRNKERSLWNDLKDSVMSIDIIDVNIPDTIISFETLLESGYTQHLRDSATVCARIYHKIMSVAMEPKYFIDLLISKYLGLSNILIRRYFEINDINDFSIDTCNDADRRDILKDVFIELGLFIERNYDEIV